MSVRELNSNIMTTCRTCLKTPADKNISQLEKAVNEDNKKCVDIMMFCLDITVTANPKITTNLCKNCYRKIISFYKFKALSLKNDDYLKSLYPSATLEDQGISVYVDENGMKDDRLDPDKRGPNICTDIKEELDVKYEDIEYIESDNELQRLEEENSLREFKDESKENAPEAKTRNPSKKIKPSKVSKFKPKPKICEECGKSVLHLKLHSVVHLPKSQRQMLQCKACPKLFSSNRGRLEHYRIQHLGFKFECDICHKKVACLSAHKVRVHFPDLQKFGCVLCERRFHSQHKLDLHMRIHTKVRPFECDLCHMKFRAKDRMSRHIRQVHLKEKSHQCHLCPKSFFENFFLDEHIRTQHMKERPFECGDCGKFYATKDSLKQHQLLHSGVKAFRCQLCDKSFAIQTYLTNHMITHTKEKNYPCQFCGARFTRPHARTRHERNVHQKHNAA